MNESETDDILDLADTYEFTLPKELIAQEPLENRADSRLLVTDRTTQSLTHSHFRDIWRFLKPGDCLVLNDTKVVSAQLVGKRVSTGGRWQGLVVQSDGEHWKMLAKTRGKIQPGERVQLTDRDGKARLDLLLVAKSDDGFWIGKPDLNSTVDSALKNCDLDQLLQEIGRVPLPHYIRGGNMVDADLKNYQTIYAKNSGAVAAPTAGLHFTKSLIEMLIERGISIAAITLHVGIGTFRPLSTDTLSNHEMHSEKCFISEQAADKINECRRQGGRVIAVGTTSVRVLESVADANGNIANWSGESNLFIKHGYRFKVVDGLITNFHLPKSTLIVLVRTFGGHELIKKAYAEAIQEQYRFFSYGDAMLIV